ncbi:hypothetical protein [Desulfotignum balticum]|uniref:hypothetical protein n=1 Tax=Desulfotignum balticum TaxID=115781 RepID=UPI0012EBD1F2|nr:hypothetical protein [Desulfotignum balticum]
MNHDVISNKKYLSIQYQYKNVLVLSTQKRNILFSNPHLNLPIEFFMGAGVAELLQAPQDGTALPCRGGRL